MSARSRNRLVWAAMIVLLAVLGFKTRDHFAAYFAGIGKLDVRMMPSEDTLYLRWRGKIDAPMASRIAEAFARHKDEAHKIILTLSSPGGSLDQGAEVVRLLDRIGQTHMLVTSVDAGGICASMCVPVYLRGQRRIAAANAEFMFHEVNFRDFFSKEKDPSVPDSAIGAETDRFFDTYFETAGVPQSWIGKVRADVAGGHEVWKTGRELLDEKSGIVQQLM
ncbi:ATP-dependent Clp protease proteolytic subunit [Hyphomicrobium sp.]|jgi:hypothetical protein|uniref:ATP-dependent Clp protease proteolytic subunit n=1 Tax=Hyphomicrobium sp. TaxID=82 RepID=UPI00356572FD